MSWRERLQPASFRGVPFHVDAHSSGSSRRLSVHQFPGVDQKLIFDLGPDVDVVAAIEDAFRRLKKIGVPSGILTLNEGFAKHLGTLGAGFTAIGTDISSLMRDVSALKARFD